ncbi:MAG TPA: 6-phospho-beta-glucosidase [Intrasporangium sp.]|uniref:6-phospho-beta-glucosidase n=1 Tax=Intrasporangium sp. TaxID=1925024 RepID=UPI002D79CAFA|nr:6-phospho-beta-glucosidase [Intrasporangium sp.]HET7397206.1 6-phospho-beta-glucosidase [Intrasporangium sp.]
MRLVILGGGGFRVPLVHGALLGDRGPRRVDEVVLHDTDATRLDAIARVLAQQAEGHDDPPRLTVTRDLDGALDGADAVFSAIRVGGLAGRTADERVALDLGLLGQETTGPGGVAYGLRTVPVAVDIAERVRRLAPTAWVVNFTNPAGMITEAMQSVLGDRVVGICDSPLGLARRAALALGRRLEDVDVDYAGLNHLGWLQGLRADGRDVLPQLLADPSRLGGMEEGHLFGIDWLQTLGVLPNEYLYYYYFTRDAIASLTASPTTRGEFLLGQQRDFYAAVGRAPEAAWSSWDAARRERNATYMREARTGEGQARDDVDGGGYEGVALALLAALGRDEPATLVLNVRNGRSVPGLAEDAVVEVPCRVTASGPVPCAVSPLTGHPLGLVQQVKAVERLTIRAAREGAEAVAVEALALHPLVDSVTTARQLLAGYRSRIPELDRVFAPR